MTNIDVKFKVGDRVIHSVHGLGEITKVEEKEMSGETRLYYEVQMENLVLYIPVDPNNSKTLRYPTPENEFPSLFQILADEPQPLPVDRYDRQLFLTEKMEKSTLEYICQVIRDLSMHSRVEKMNESDKSILQRATSSLLNEWSGVLSVPIQQAEIELQELLKSS